MNTLLAFDTSMTHCAASLWRDGSVVDFTAEEMARGQAERLMPLLEGLLARHRLTWRDLDRIGVGIGPGNFTGIRISVAAARGLALGLNVPAIGVSIFETTRALSGHNQVAVPAPRNQAYVQDFTTAAKPELAQTVPEGFTLSAGFDGAAHVRAIAEIAASRTLETTATPPAPLYVKPADAAPPKENPPVILDEA